MQVRVGPVQGLRTPLQLLVPPPRPAQRAPASGEPAAQHEVPTEEEADRRRGEEGDEGQQQGDPEGQHADQQDQVVGGQAFH